jgi:hypothetical protein
MGWGWGEGVRCASNAKLIQLGLSECIPMCCCKAVPSHSLCLFLCNTFTSREHAAQAVLSICKPLHCCKAVITSERGVEDKQDVIDLKGKWEGAKKMPPPPSPSPPPLLPPPPSPPAAVQPAACLQQQKGRMD